MAHGGYEFGLGSYLYEEVSGADLARVLDSPRIPSNKKAAYKNARFHACK